MKFMEPYLGVAYSVLQHGLAIIVRPTVRVILSSRMTQFKTYKQLLIDAD